MTVLIQTAPVSEGFSVRVGDFEGPFDLLLSLISKHKLEVTEIALHLVTDEFVSYIRGKGGSGISTRRAVFSWLLQPCWI